MRLIHTLALAAVVGLTAIPAYGQKKEDTLRFAFNDSFTTLSN